MGLGDLSIPIPSIAFLQHPCLYLAGTQFACVCADMHGKDVLSELV